jgi:poly-beta-1,6-N-acetyl-D-glucosamine synthase
MSHRSSRMIRISIGVFAYNEERTIGQTLEALLRQEFHEVQVIELLVISSDSTDKTDAIVSRIADENPVVRLIRESARRGKSAAINRYLSEKSPQADVCVMVSADLLPNHRSVEHLALALTDPTIGMAGGRPLPVNKADHFLGFIVQLQWNLHHLISLIHPKCGEMVAFRADLTSSIPAESPVDEASLEAIATAKSLHLKYVPEATFLNRGPETFHDFIAQRRRIANGHLWLEKTADYHVATGSSWLIMKLLVNHPPQKPIEWLWTAGAISLEAYCRLLGTYDFYFRPRAHQAWQMVTSTKKAFDGKIQDTAEDGKSPP